MTEDAGRELRGGRYVVTRALGEGAQGDTLEAIDKSVGRLVAVKRFRVRGAGSWKDVELAEREARVLGSLSHPRLPAHIEHFEEGGVLYLVMERIDGESLGALRRRGGVLGRDDVVRFLHDASEILEYLHGRAPPVIHRDIKPSNVIRKPDGSFAIVDFGAVRDRLKPEGGSTVVGTFGYMAPEQFQGRALPGSDVYAVGATALCMLTGQEPEKLPHKGLALDVPAALRGRADPALIQVLSSMLQPDPDQRAPRIAPLLAQLTAGRARDDRVRRGEADRERGRAGRSERRGDRDARRDAQRTQRRAAVTSPGARGRDDAWGGLPLPLPVILIGLVLARFAVILSLEVFVPLVLTLLSIVFGRALRESAAHVRETGRTADRALLRAMSAVRGEPGAGPRVRIHDDVDDARSGVDRVRVPGDARYDDDGEPLDDTRDTRDADDARPRPAGRTPSGPPKR